MKLNVLICASAFIFGLCIVILLTVSELSPLEYQAVNGTYHSYRENHVSSHTTYRYLSIENSDDVIVEYKIQQIAFRAFDKKYFLQEAAVGDPIELTLQEGEIVSIRTNGKSYMNEEDSLEKQRNNTVTGYCIGGIFIVGSLLAFSSLIEVRRGRRSKKRRR